MALQYTNTKIGTIRIKHTTGKRYNIEIRQGNCLAVFIYRYKDHGKEKNALYNFFADEKHMKNIMASYDKVMPDEVVKCELNMYYKESWKLLKYFMLSKYEVTCYYEKPKNA